VGDLVAARAGEPDQTMIEAAVKVTAALVLGDEGHQGLEHFRQPPEGGSAHPSPGDCRA